jgi:PAS domain S-box-containing protein
MIDAKMIKVLLVEDSPSDALIVEDELTHAEGGEFCVVHLEQLNAALARLQAQHFDVVLLDLNLPDSQGFETFLRLHDAASEVPIVVLTARDDENLALKAVKAGAQDYLVKGRMGEEVLQRSIRYAIERRRSEQTLAESEERYRLLIERSPDAYLVHCDGEVVFANAASLKLFGATHLDQLLGRSFLETVSPEFHEIISKRVPNAQTNGSNPPTEVLGTRLDGTTVAVQGTSNPFLHEGRPAVQVVLHDITQRKLSEEATRMSVQRFELFMDNLPGYAWIKDQAWRYIYANKSCRQVAMAGREWFGKTDDELWPPELAASFRASDKKVRENEEPVQCVEMIGQTGEKRAVLSSKFPIFNGNSEVAFVCGIGIDITERRRAEERVREQADIINLAPDAIVVRDLQGHIQFWNKGAERLYGWTALEVDGRSVHDIFYDPLGPFHAASIALEKKGKWSGELQPRCKDGSTVTVDARCTGVSDENGQPKSVLSIYTDITERKDLEARFLRAQRVESIGALASGVAHDLNNILSPILMGAAVLRRSEMAKEDGMILSTIETCAQRGADIVKQVLTFARGAEGARLLLQPSHLITDMAKIAEGTFPKAITIRTKYPQSLWPIEGDPTQLHQVLLNLCVNARDAMPAGGMLTISAENFPVDQHYASMTPGATAGPHVLLEVKDAGMGIPREIIDKIFDPFFTTKELGHGTGLGLSTVIGIVRSHGGFLSVESEIGRGASFKVYLPAKVDAQAAPPDHEITIPPMANGELLLIVDDETSILEVAQALLEGHGYRVLKAADATEALAIFALRKDEIALVLTDLAMPLMDGLALIRTLQKMKPDVCIVASSGHGSPERSVRELPSLNVRACLTKPYNKETLLNTLHDALNYQPDKP